MREALRKAGRILLWALGLVVGLVLLALILIQTPVVKDWIRGEVERRTNEAIEGQIEIDRISGNFLRSVTAHDVILRDGRDRPLARIDRISASYWLLSLVTNGLEVENIRIDQPRLLARRYEDGTLNLATLTDQPPDEPEAPSEPTDFDIPIDNYTLTDGVVVWQDLELLAEETELEESTRTDLGEAADRAILAPEEADSGAPLEEFASELAAHRRARTSIPGNVLVDRFSLEGQVDLNLLPRVENELRKLSLRARTDTLPEAHALSLSEVRTVFRADRLETTLDSFEVTPGLALTDTSLYADIATDEEGGIEQFAADLGRLEITREMLDPFVEGVSLRSGIELTARAGGTPEHLYLRPTIELDGEGKLDAAAELNLPNDDMSYRAALVGEKLDAGEIVDAGQPPARVNLAARVDGRGTDPEQLDASTDLIVWDSAVDQVAIDRLSVRAGGDDGRYRLNRLAFVTSHIIGESRGSFSLDGTFDLRAKTRSAEGDLSTRALGLEDGPPARADRADLDVTTSGKLDLEANTPLAYLERTELDARWDLRNVRYDQFRLGRSSGNIDLTASESDTDPPDQSVEAEARATAARLRVGEFTLTTARFDLDASGRIATESGQQALRTLDSSWSTRVDGLRNGPLTLESVSANGTLGTGSGGRTYTSATQLNLNTLSSESLQISNASATFDARAVLSSSLDADLPIERISTTGDANFQSLAAPSTSADRGHLKFDFSGAPTDPVGALTANVSEVNLADRSFEDVRLEVETESGRTARVQFEAQPTLYPQRPYLLDVTAGYSADFSVFDFESLEFGRPEQKWRLATPSTLSVGSGTVSIDEFRLVNQKQSITVDGTFRQIGRQSLTLAIEQFDVGDAQDLVDIHPVADLDARIDVSFELGGTHLDPTADLSVEVADLTALDYGPFGLVLGARSNGQRVKIQQLQTSAVGHLLSTLSADLPISWALTGAFDFGLRRSASIDFDIEKTPLQRIGAALSNDQFESIGGDVGGSFDLAGSFADPAVELALDISDFSVTGTMNGVAVDLRNVASSTSFRYGKRQPDQKRIALDSEITWDERKTFGLEFRTDAPVVDWAIAHSEGRLSRDEFLEKALRAPVHLSLTLDETDVGQLPLEVVRQADGQGRVSASATLDGTLLKPDAQADLDVDDFGWQQYRDIFIDLEATFSEQMLRLGQFRVEWDADEVLVARGKLPIPSETLGEQRAIENLPIDFTLQINPIPIAKLSAIDYSFTQIQGELSGYLRVNGSLRSPDVEARLAVVDALFSRDHRGTAAVWLWGDQGRLRGGMMACRDTQPILTGQYDVPLNLDLLELAAGNSPLSDGQLEASLEGKNIPIEQLVPMPLLDDWIAGPEGYLQVDLGLEGTWDDPRPYGQFGVEEGAITIIEFGRRFDNINISTRLDREQFALERLHLEGADGKVDASGSVQLDGLAPTTFSMNARTNQFNIGGIATDFPVAVTTKTKISGERAGEQLRADIDVTDLNVEVSDSEQQGTHPTALSSDIIITEAKNIEDATEISEYLTQGGAGNGLTSIQFDVNIDRNSFVRHPNGYLNFSSELSGEVRGSQTLLTGQVTSIRGDFEFLGRQFEIPNREAVVQFTGASPPNPRLNVLASYPLPSSVVSELDPPLPENPAIQVQVTGTANEPNLELSADPTMSETDIIFVLMTGRAPTTAEVGESQGVASQAAAAAGGIFAGLLQQRLSKTLPVDVLRFEAGEGGLAGSQLRVGKYITSNLFISYAQRFGSEEDSAYEARVEYHFLPSWMLEAQYGENQTGAVNVFWDLY
jgi:autotransporter translocation and assembly factor TamB